MVNDRLRTQVKNDVRIVVRHLKIPKMAAILAHLVWYPGRNGIFDADNIAPTLKPCLDALVVAGVLIDDNSERVLGTGQQVIIRRQDPEHRPDARLYLVIRDMSALAPITGSPLRSGYGLESVPAAQGAGGSGQPHSAPGERSTR
jgi:hypothetical protein